jgi:hypothetical protein
VVCMASSSQIGLFLFSQADWQEPLEKMKFAFDVSKCESEGTQGKNHLQTKGIKFRLKLGKFE